MREKPRDPLIKTACLLLSCFMACPGFGEPSTLVREVGAQNETAPLLMLPSLAPGFQPDSAIDLQGAVEMPAAANEEESPEAIDAQLGETIAASSNPEQKQEAQARKAGIQASIPHFRADAAAIGEKADLDKFWSKAATPEGMSEAEAAEGEYINFKNSNHSHSHIHIFTYFYGERSADLLQYH